MDFFFPKPLEVRFLKHLRSLLVDFLCNRDIAAVGVPPLAAEVTATEAISRTVYFGGQASQAPTNTKIRYAADTRSSDYRVIQFF